jgi:hypothetical protein
MTEAEARALLLLRTFDPPAASEADADPALAARRAARLAGREPAAAAALRAATWPRGAAAALVAAAFAAGLVLDSLGPAGRIHLLSAPLALLAWNVAVYALLALHALRALARREPADTAAGPLREALAGGMRRLGAARGHARAAETARFLADWAALAAPLHRARVARLLHLGAAALAAGLLASLYLRGLFLEYRAGWDSTFLTPEAVHRLLSWVLWPALQLSGGALPGPDALARLRFSAGGGENAAQWIHWIALTVAVGVVLPRALLAAAAGRRAARLARAFPWPAAVEAATPAAAAAAPPAVARSVRVLPYSYRPPRDCEPALRDALARRLGTPIALRLEPTVPLGAEETPETWRRADAPGALAVPLFALTATPERETHGAFLAALFAADAAAPRVLLVDESGFRRRFGGAQGEARLAERRAAWQRLADAADAMPWFEDLALLEPPAQNAPDPATASGASSAQDPARPAAGEPSSDPAAAGISRTNAEPRR